MKTFVALLISSCLLETTAFLPPSFAQPSARRIGQMSSSTRPEIEIDFEMPSKGITEYGEDLARGSWGHEADMVPS